MTGRNWQRCAGVALAATILTMGVSSAVADAPAHDEPILVDGKLVFPEGALIPPYETELEKRLADLYGTGGARGQTPPPTGPVHCVAEYEPMESIMMAYESFYDLIDEMAAQITTVGDADVYLMCDTNSEANSALSFMAAAGADTSRVHPMVVTTDSVWIRDYGPRYIYEGDVRAVVDHTYNRSFRPNDNQIPGFFAQQRGHQYYKLPLVHGGGNYHLDALGHSNTTRLINNENPGLTEQQIHDIWMDYQNVDTTFHTPFPTFVDSTQHIDMWMQIYGDEAIMISDWPFNSGSTQDNICDNAAADFAAAGWEVRRIPARSVGGTHYTYTNVVMCNDLVLLPLYTNSSVAQHNSEALTAWQNAVPGKTIVQIDSENIVQYAGVLHCIVMHVPEPKGGANPTAYLQNYNGGETLTPGNNVMINWLSDDDNAVTSVDILLSTDDGATYDTTIVTGTTDDGAYTWQVPDVFAPQARLRVVVHDGDGNSGSDDSDGSFMIDGTPGIPGDLVAPLGVVDIFDLFELLANWGTAGPGADLAAPTDVVDVFDLFVLLGNWS